MDRPTHVDYLAAACDHNYMRSRPLAVLAAVAVAASLLVAPAATAAPVAPAAPAAAPTVTRLEGANQYSIAVRASQAAFPTAGSADVVLVVNGEDYQSAVIASAAAAALNGPVIYVSKSSITPSAKAEIARLAPEKIIVIGDTSLVSAKVAAPLKAQQPNYLRIGSNDYTEAEQLVRLAFPDGADHVYLAAGKKSATSVSASALAAADAAPLLLARTTDTKVRVAAKDLYAELGTTRVTVIGGYISAGYVKELGKLGITVDRLTTTTSTSANIGIANRITNPGGVLVASAPDYDSALGALATATATRSPIVLTTPYCATPELLSYLKTSSATSMTVVGTTAVVRGLVDSLEPCRDITKASSTWVFVNKKNKLKPASYVPSGLRLPNVVRTGSHKLKDAAADALEEMAADARSAGVGRVGIVSGYRSYSTQKALYARYVRTNGQAWADSQSARAGFSEHQTGLSADLAACSASSCSSIYSIASTPQGKWLAKNSWKYGFVMRYESGKTSTTGYAFEPWHFRFVGTELAADYHAGGFTTLERYFGKPAAPKY